MITDTPHEWPLFWPPRKRRTPSEERRAGTFNAERRNMSVIYALWRVRRELNFLGVSGLRLSSNVQVAEAGGMLGREAYLDPGVSACFELHGTDYAIACDRYTTPIDNLIAIAKHLEAIRSVERYGVGSAPDALQTFQVVKDMEAAERPTRPWREILGDLGRVQDVASVFRRLSAAHHPDAATGSHEAMTGLSRARDEAIRELECREPSSDGIVPEGESEVFVFEAARDFGAMRAAEQFLEERGFSYGLNQRGGAPRGILFGSFDIPKWGDLSEKEREALDGTMSGDMRRGPVTVAISKIAMARPREPELNKNEEPLRLSLFNFRRGRR